MLIIEQKFYIKTEKEEKEMFEKNSVNETRSEVMKRAIERADNLLNAVKADAATLIRVDIRDSLVQTSDYSSYFTSDERGSGWRR